MLDQCWTFQGTGTPTPPIIATHNQPGILVTIILFGLHWSDKIEIAATRS